MQTDSFDFLSGVTSSAVKVELERASIRFHKTIAWIAILLDPVFVITDYYNIPQDWQKLLVMRLLVACSTLATVLLSGRFKWPSFVVAFVPFFLISMQNAYVYSVVSGANVLGQNLNYMALLIGAAMFVLWRWYYSVGMILISVAATAFFLNRNAWVTPDYFFVQGGLLLLAVGIFSVVLIQTRYRLVVREVRARLALRASNKAIQFQAEQIKRINENLEQMVKERTKELEFKNKALEDAAFINAHKLRAPVASILGLVSLMQNVETGNELQNLNGMLLKSTQNLDEIVSEITTTLEARRSNSPG